jgi:hypothetical protein
MDDSAFTRSWGQVPIADNTGVAVALLGQLYFVKARIQN